jgi:hypothetical protein
MTPTHTRRNGSLYRYYVSMDDQEIVATRQRRIDGT